MTDMIRDKQSRLIGRGAAGRTTAAISLSLPYRLHFTSSLFDSANATLADVIDAPNPPAKVLVCIDAGVAQAQPQVAESARAYIADRDNLTLADDAIVIPGGEQAKNDTAAYDRVVKAIHDAGICRQSYVLAIGGGAVLDAVGYAAATAHRGVRLIRAPSTTLAQCDAGIGVKNGINAFGKKNFLGTFAVPWAVLNDTQLLTTLSDRDWRCGLSEAVKVALVKDAAFFKDIESAASQLCARDAATAQPILERCAHLHLQHIVDGGDPFELTQARPLDFGHWAAHKLEQMTGWSLRHGEAVAIGIALDVTYAANVGMLADDAAQRVLACLEALGFALYHNAMGESETLLTGLEEFREHLGGELTVQMLTAIGTGVDVHAIDRQHMITAIQDLHRRNESLR